MEKKNTVQDAAAFVDIDRLWSMHNRGAVAVSFWPQAAFYTTSLLLAIGWLSPDLWEGRCGTPCANQFSACILFAAMAFSAAAWAGLWHRHWGAAVRFLISGIVPFIPPLLVYLVIGSS